MINRRSLVVLALGVSIGLVVIMVVSWSKTARREFVEQFDTRSAAHGLTVASDGWNVSWRRAVMSTTNLTVQSAGSSEMLLQVPLVEVDFNYWKLLSGWNQAVYQIYLHQPHFYVHRDVAQSWNWYAPFGSANMQAIASQAQSDPQARFNLERLYADVVTLHWRGTDETLQLDNGVLTVRDLCLPFDSREGATAVVAHARLAGGKVSLTGSANFFRWRNVSDGLLWDPTGEFVLSTDGVGARAAALLTLPATGQREFKTNR